MTSTIVACIKRQAIVLRGKLASQRGESLAEVLVAILISSLGMLMLASAISSSYSIVRQGRAATERQYDVEKELADPASGSVDSVTVEFVELGNDQIGTSESVDVKMVSENVVGYGVFSYTPKGVTTP